MTMFAVTLTVVKNHTDDQALHIIEQLIKSLKDHPGASGGDATEFETMGRRQVRGWFHSADDAVGFILSASRSGTWGVHLTLVPFVADQNDQLQWPRDLAFLPNLPPHNGGTYDATRAPGGVRVMMLQSEGLVDSRRDPVFGPIEASLQLLCSIERRRSDEGQEAGLLINSGNSQVAAAQHLGVSQQAISSRLQSGYWYESRRVAYWLASQLSELVKS